MGVTFLTTEDASLIVTQLANIQKVIDELYQHMASMGKYETKIFRLAEKEARWKEQMKYYHSKRYANKIIKEYLKQKQKT